MRRNRRKLPEIIIDKRLWDAIKKKKREISVEISAGIDLADAVQFILGDALGLCVGADDCDWVLQEDEKPTPRQKSKLVPDKSNGGVK